MAKHCPQETYNAQEENLKASKETIAFLLNYSKALRVIENEDMQYELILN